MMVAMPNQPDHRTATIRTEQQHDLRNWTGAAIGKMVNLTRSGGMYEQRDGNCRAEQQHDRHSGTRDTVQCVGIKDREHGQWEGPV